MVEDAEKGLRLEGHVDGGGGGGLRGDGGGGEGAREVQVVGAAHLRDSGGGGVKALRAGWMSCL